MTLGNMSHDKLVVVKTDAGEGEYLMSAYGADCFAALLKAIGYTAEIEEIDSAAQHEQSNEGSEEAF